MRRLAMITAGLFVCLFAQARAAEPLDRQLRDWRVVCDNLGNCAAHSNDAEQSGWGGMLVRRAAGAKGAVEAVLNGGSQVSADGGLQDMAGWHYEENQYRSTDARAIDRFIQTIRDAQELEVGSDTADGSDLQTVSLKGLSAALLLIDETQGRLDTPSAWIRKGNQAPSSIPGPHTAAVLRPAPLPPTLGKREQGQLLEAATRRARADIEDCEAGPEMPGQAFALDKAHALVSVICCRGAYQEGGPLYRTDRGNPASMERVQLPVPGGVLDDLTFVDFDPATARLSHFAKGRGIGDCGEAASWVYDGREFKLAEYATMPACTGFLPDDWPVSWTTSVQR